jgi:hypothetical protein
MKKLTLVLILFIIVFFEYCSSSKKSQKMGAPKTSYTANVQSIITQSCSPCHIGPQARVKKLDNYDAVKNNIDEIISRIQRNPGDKGFMPFKHSKLSDADIRVFVNWKEGGLAQ